MRLSVQYLLLFFFGIQIFTVYSGEFLVKSGGKKIIECGWDSPTIQFFHDQIREIEKAPYDGVRLKLERPVVLDGKTTIQGWQTLADPQKWDSMWFSEDLALLKNTRSETLTDNFLSVGFPRYAPWADDERWEALCHNLAIMAKLAKEGGLKGIMLDSECYASPLQFKYYSKDGSRDELWQLARLRGRQFMNALASEYPDMTLFSFLLFTMNSRFLDGEQSQEMLALSDYELKIPFLNGMLDVIPPEMKLVEGNEAAGYTASSREALLEGYFRAGRAIQNSMFPENQKKISQVKIASSIYLDAYFVWREKQREPYALFGNLEHPEKLDAFRRMLADTLDISDGYTWSWGECGKWWPIELQKNATERITIMYQRDPMWINSVSGITDAFYAARNPLKAALQLVQDQKPGNLITNSSFDKIAPDGTPANWSTWSVRNSKAFLKVENNVGSGKDDDFAAVAGNAAMLTFTQAFKVSGGQEFMVSGYFKIEGEASASIEIGWGIGGRQRVELERVMVPPEEKSVDGWVFCRSLITVPSGKDLLFVHLYALNAENGQVRFDRISLYPVNFLPFYRERYPKAAMRPLYLNNLSITDFLAHDNTLSGSVTNADPSITISGDFNLNTDKQKMVKFTMKLDRPVKDKIQIFWTTDEKGFNEAKSVTQEFTSSDREMEFIFDMSKHPGWNGIIHRLRIDPVERTREKIHFIITDLRFE